MKQYESDLNFRFAVFSSKTSSGGQRVWVVGNADALYISASSHSCLLKKLVA